jgi:hypothetical protein
MMQKSTTQVLAITVAWTYQGTITKIVLERKV